MGLPATILDPSTAMLASAGRRGLSGVRGVAQAMPFRSRCFGLVWFHLSIHYGDWRVAIDESVRVLDEGGRVEIWTLGPDHHERSMLARWFPSVVRIDSERFPPPEALAEYLERRVTSVSVTHPVEAVVRGAGSWLTAVEAGFISTLQLLPDAERAAGIEAFRRAHPDPYEDVEYHLRFTHIVGT
jgi:SAM-dependent methyltransferase